jgi:hypothetical protein
LLDQFKPERNQAIIMFLSDVDKVNCGTVTPKAGSAPVS